MELINWIWFAGAIASAATLGIADGKARNIQPIEALWLALLWVTETLLAAMQFGRNWHKCEVRECPLLRRCWGDSGRDADIVLRPLLTHRRHERARCAAPHSTFHCGLSLTCYCIRLVPGAKMKRREFIALLGGGAVSWPVVAHAQQLAMPVIGYLGFGSPESFATRLAAFRQGLQETGYREGENVKIEYRWAKGQNDQLPGLAADLVSHRVNVIATPGSANAARAAKLATVTIPIVFETGADPVATGLVTSLNRPNGNITGVSSLNVQVGQKRLEVLHQLLPTTTVVAALVNPTNVNTEAIANDLRAAAKTLSLRLHILHANSQRDFDVVFSKLPQLGADALIVSPDPLFTAESGQLVALTLRQRVPTLFFSRDFVAAGGLLSYGGSIAESHHQAGIYTGRILKGAKPADLPVQEVTKFELVINLKTAKMLGLTVPQGMIVAADELIE